MVLLVLLLVALLPVGRPAAPSAGVSAPRSAALVEPGVAGSEWFNVTAGQRAAPPPLVGASVVFDPADSELVLFGGCTASACPAAAQTWVYFGGAWTNITASGPQPPARSYAGFTYDSRDGYAVLFGGMGASGPLNDTWSFSGGVWTNLTVPTLIAPSPRWAPQLGFDRADNYVVLFGGCGATCPLNDTWHFVAGGWRNVTSGLLTSPAPRYGAGFTYDNGDNYLLLVGGCGATCPLNDTWQFSHNRWVQIPVNTSAAPPPRAFATLTFDAVQNATFLFGGNGSAGPLGDTWRWSGGKWANLTSQVGTPPSPRFGAGAVQTTFATVGSTVHRWTFDLVFGGTGGPGPFSVTGANAETWVAEPPPSATASVDPSLVEVGQVAAFTGTGTGGSPPYVFLWQFGDGTSSLAQDPGHVYPAPAMYVPNVTVTDTAGVAMRASTTITVVEGPSLGLTISPSSTDVFRTVGFSAQVNGGTSPYVFHWSFGDGGTASSLDANHSYGAPGTYLVNLTVTDTVQGIGVRFANVTVHADPSITTTVSTASPTVGALTVFTAQATLGTGPYSYLWSFGDGNTSTNASATHAYARPGPYRVSVTVTDSVGAAATQNITVTVQAVPAGGGPTRWAGLTDVQWGYIVLGLGAAVAAASAVVLLVRHRRRPPGTPIAAAAVGQPGWGDEEASGPPSSSRSFRRGYRR